jgi:thiol:disulfide interchange protein DsbD
MNNVLRATLFIFLSLFVFCRVGGQQAALGQLAVHATATQVSRTADSAANMIAAPAILATPITPKQDNNSNGFMTSRQPLWLVFIEALLIGLLAVFTPYVYAFVPMTISTLVFRSKTRAEGNRHTAYFSFFLVFIFTAIGATTSLIAGTTGLSKLTHNWIFNLFFFRFLAGLGMSLLGAFEISLPVRLIRATHSRASSGKTDGLFFLALTLPVVTFSSTFPLTGLVLLLSSKGGFAGPIAGMVGFSLGLTAPFIYPRLINLMPASVLNYIKVLMGFIMLLLGMKFFSNADIAKGWEILDRQLFIAIWIIICLLVCVHLLGWLKFSNDYVPAQNIYGQEYVSLIRLFFVIAAFTLAIYLLPGIWGAPLNAVSEFLPPQPLP